MKRINLPEIEDSPACPAFVRNAMTGYLHVALEVGKPYAVVAPKLAALLRDGGRHRILDLASGGGGPWPALRDALVKEGVTPEIELSEVQPNREAAAQFEDTEGIRYRPEPVSALDLPNSTGEVRTMFTGLHHFEPHQVRTIFESAQRDGAPFLAAEATHRSIKGILITLLIPLLVLLLMPRVRPRRFLPLLLTYLPPILPILIWWDGFASTLKTFSADELKSIASEIQQPGYTWRVEEMAVPGSPIPVTIVYGRPDATE